MSIRFLIPLLGCLSVFPLHAQTSLAVINGASYQVNFPVAPGSYAQVYGNFAGVPETRAAAIPLPKELAGVQVQVDGVAAPLYAVGSTVVSFLVPGAAKPGPLPIRVLRSGSALGSGTMNVIASAPGIFHVGADAGKQGGILNQRSQYADRSAPARRGEVIQIFATGQGAVDRPVEDGAVPTSQTNTTTVPEVYVSVERAQVQFSGLSPQFPGLWQINVIVPDKDYIQGQVPLYVKINGINSNAVSFWVGE